MEAPSNPNEDESSRIVAAVAAVTFIAVITVTVRLYVRIKMLRSFGWDDALITLTTACAIVGFALAVVQTEYGAGRHRGDVPPDDYEYGMLVNFVNQPIYLFAICFVKLAVGAALMRIATKPIYKRSILGVMIFMLVYTIVCFFTIIFQCTDIRVLWNPSIPATCWPARTIVALSYTNAALNITTDLLFSIAIPLPMLWKLQVNFRTWVTLICILGIGVFACAAASVKVSYLPNYGKEGDLLWDSRDITIWTAVELNVAITAASLPCLKPLFKKLLATSSKYGRGSSYDAAGGTDRKSRSGRRGTGVTESRHAAATAAKFSTRPARKNSSESESQLVYELDGQVKAFVHNDSTTTTEIVCQEVKGQERSCNESVSYKVSDTGILTTTTTTVQYSLR